MGRLIDSCSASGELLCSCTCFRINSPVARKKREEKHRYGVDYSTSIHSYIWLIHCSYIRLSTGSNTLQTYARTGYLGFLRRTEAIGCDGGGIFHLEICHSFV